MSSNESRERTEQTKKRMSPPERQAKAFTYTITLVIICLISIIAYEVVKKVQTKLIQLNAGEVDAVCSGCIGSIGLLEVYLIVLSLALVVVLLRSIRRRRIDDGKEGPL